MANLSGEPFDHYIPQGPLNEAPGGGFQPPHVRRKALTAILRGAEVGQHDEEYLDWLSALDDNTCRTLGSVMWRARLAGRAEITSTVANLLAYVDEVLDTTDRDLPNALEHVGRELDLITEYAECLTDATTSVKNLRAYADEVPYDAAADTETRDLLNAIRYTQSEVARIVHGRPAVTIPVPRRGDLAAAFDRARALMEAAEAGSETLAEYVGTDADEASPVAGTNTYGTFADALTCLVKAVDQLMTGNGVAKV